MKWRVFNKKTRGGNPKSGRVTTKKGTKPTKNQTF